MFMTPLSATQIETYNAKGGSNAENSDPKAAQERFMKLFVAQLNNQDPMNPLDNAQMTTQMAQINTVSGIQQVNETLKGLSQQFASGQMLQGVSLIGRTALLDGNQPVVENGSAFGGFNLGAAASTAKVDVLDANGLVLGSTTLTGLEAGHQFFQVDLGADVAARAAKFKVTAESSGKAVEAKTMTLAPVAAVGMQSGNITLTAANGKTFGYDQVLGYR